jgi:hypothetical protein
MSFTLIERSGAQWRAVRLACRYRISALLFPRGRTGRHPERDCLILR